MEHICAKIAIRTPRIWKGRPIKYLKIILVLFFGVSLWKSSSYLLSEKNEDVILPPRSVASSICINPLVGIGLANKMFQYASGYGIATLLQKKLILPKQSEVFRAFKNIHGEAIDEQECPSFPLVKEKSGCAYDDNIYTDLMPGHSYNIHRTFLQSWKYFKAVESQIREQFIFNERIRDTASTYLRTHTRKYNINPSHVKYVGIHVRRGDKLGPEDVERGYQVAPKEYFIRAINYFKQIFKSVVFIVATAPADRSWVTKNILVENVILIEDINPGPVDMAILTMCNHTIMSVGTFGWWAGFLADGITVYYRHPVREGSEIRKCYSSDFLDHFYPRWIGLD